jgi:hypothetical protein
MLLVVIAAAAIAPMPPAPKASAQAQARVRIERPAIVTREEWEKLPQSVRSEKIVRDEHGRPMLLRLKEHQ